MTYLANRHAAGAKRAERLSGHPAGQPYMIGWIPAFAGMTSVRSVIASTRRCLRG